MNFSKCAANGPSTLVRASLVNCYNENHYLWNHKLSDYHKKGKPQLLLGQLVENLDGKYLEKEIAANWNNLNTYSNKERMREEGS